MAKKDTKFLKAKDAQGNYIQRGDLVRVFDGPQAVIRFFNKFFFNLKLSNLIIF